MKLDLKAFFTTLLIKQNKWHNHSVLGHTLKVVFKTIQAKQYRMIPAALLHDIGKPYSAYQDDEDKLTDEYSFTNHEEISYLIIKNWPSWLVSDYTKDLVRYHYLIRGSQKAMEKGQIPRYKRLIKILNKLTPEFKKELYIFKALDDKGK